MRKRNSHRPKISLSKIRKEQDKKIYIDFLRKTVLQKLGTTYNELKANYTQERIFFLALQHVTTPKKDICLAFGLEVEKMCFEKRKLEKAGLLVQTYKRYKTKCTTGEAHYLTTDPAKFHDILHNFKL